VPLFFSGLSPKGQTREGHVERCRSSIQESVDPPTAPGHRFSFEQTLTFVKDGTWRTRLSRRVPLESHTGCVITHGVITHGTHYIIPPPRYFSSREHRGKRMPSSPLKNCIRPSRPYRCAKYRIKYSFRLKFPLQRNPGIGKRMPLLNISSTACMSDAHVIRCTIIIRFIPIFRYNAIRAESQPS